MFRKSFKDTQVPRLTTRQTPRWGRRSWQKLGAGGIHRETILGKKKECEPWPKRLAYLENGKQFIVTSLREGSQQEIWLGWNSAPKIVEKLSPAGKWGEL